MSEYAFIQSGSHENRDLAKTMNNMELRGEIDTSPPFGSVKEAVTRFGGSGFWIPMHLLSKPHHGFEEFDINKVEEHAAKLEKDLTLKEKEKLNVLKELELTKRIIDELKHKVHLESSQNEVTPDFNMPSPVIKEMNEKTCNSLVGNRDKNLSVSSASSLSLILSELKQAKTSLSKTTNDLAVIRASVGSLNHQKAEKHENVVELNCENLGSNVTTKGNPFAEQTETITKKCFQNPTYISRELEQLNFEAEQFIKMAEAAKLEILRAMPGTDQTRKTAEMKWVAAKKMEEAAKAVEAVALAEMQSIYSVSESSSRPSFLQKPEGVAVPFEGRYDQKSSLDAMFRFDEANISKLAIFKKLEEATQEVKHTKYALQDAFNTVEFANKRILATEEALRLNKWGFDDHNLRMPNQVNGEKRPVLRPTISVGEILGKKPLIRGEDYAAIKRMEGNSERQKVSLSQMLTKQRSSSVLSSPIRLEKDRSYDLKHYFAKNKKFGFIHLSIPLTKQSKAQSSNVR